MGIKKDFKRRSRLEAAKSDLNLVVNLVGQLSARLMKVEAIVFKDKIDAINANASAPKVPESKL